MSDPVRIQMDLLRRYGFQFEKIYDDHHQVATVKITRVWRGVRDVVLAYGPDECAAYRVWDRDFNPSNPFVADPDVRLWSSGGHFITVTTALLSQPHPIAGTSHFPGATSDSPTGRQNTSTLDHLRTPVSLFDAGPE
ncbi:hypothetical protein GCM10012275_63860 [Longimycelium tulufanense]|uniref:Uncharacterized protein n=1 Tax=Longimycelium tulufanense TaxID=907463 RepID=A0A8J3FZG3_9PSEU|nr:hypothetical protein [Longimycelium tulufanense]GGM84415.1 hypothetical protein GCM10012275_63860 [Longimycelium tulufanense]